MAGLITIVLSGITYIATKSYDVYKELTWKDQLRVLYYKQGETSLFVNSGDGPLYVSHVEVYWKGAQSDLTAKNFRDDINLTVDAGKVLERPSKPRSERRIEDQYGTIQANDSGLYSQAMFASSAATGPADRCFRVRFYSIEHHDLLRMQDHYGGAKKKLVLVNGDARLVYFSTKNGNRYELALKVVGTFAVRDRGFRHCMKMVPDHPFVAPEQKVQLL